MSRSYWHIDVHWSDFKQQLCLRLLELVLNA